MESDTKQIAKPPIESWSKEILCRYYNYGVCKLGDACRYSHDMSKAKPDTICRYYLHGGCSYGSGCRFDHVRVPKAPVRQQPAMFIPSFSEPTGSPNNNSLTSTPTRARTNTTGDEIDSKVVLQGTASHPGKLPSRAPKSDGLSAESSPVELSKSASLDTNHLDIDSRCSSASGGSCYFDAHDVSPKSTRTATATNITTGEQNVIPSSELAPDFAKKLSPALMCDLGGAPKLSDEKSLERPAILGFEHAGGELDYLRVIAPHEWVAAPEFVPGQPYTGLAHDDFIASDEDQKVVLGELNTSSGGGATYAGAVLSGMSDTELAQVNGLLTPDGLCQLYATTGECAMERCPHPHGDLCEVCESNVLHPTDAGRREKHKKECLDRFEQEMNEAFMYERSKDKACGICMDLVMEKSKVSERRFGILDKCDHVFCLSCIRKWRGARNFENQVIRACPECRIKSDFVTPSAYWFEDTSQKAAFIDGYKQMLRNKPCKYFKEGSGDCPFNDRCFYRHALPDGTPAPPRPRAANRGARLPGRNVGRHRSQDEALVDLDTFGDIMDMFGVELALAAAIGFDAYSDDESIDEYYLDDEAHFF